MFSQGFMATTLALALGTGAAPGAARAGVNETPIQISKPASGEQDLYSDAASSSNGFVATWSRVGVAGQGNSVLVQAFAQNGRPQSKAPVVVKSGLVTLVGRSRVLRISDDQFLVVWRDMMQLYGAIYSTRTNKVSGAKTLVATNEVLTDLVMLDSGNIAILTSSYKTGTAEAYVSVSIISKALKVLKGPTPVHANAYVGFNAIGQDYAVASTKKGGVAALYDRADGQVYVQGFTAAGALAGKRVRLSKTDADFGALADRGFKTVRAVRLTNDRVFVAWASLEGNPYIDGFEVRGRFLDVTGAPVGPEILIPGTSVGKQTAPELVALPGGKVLVAWAAEELTGAKSVLARTIAANGALGPVRTVDTNADGAIGLDSDLSLIGDGSVVNVFDGAAGIMAEGIPKSQF